MKATKLILFGIFSFMVFSINAFAAVEVSSTGPVYIVKSTFITKTSTKELTRTIKAFITKDNNSAFQVLPDKLMPGDSGAASSYDCDNTGYASASEIALIQSGKKNGYSDLEIQIALYCEATTGTEKKSTDEFYQTICSRYAAGEDVIGTGAFQVHSSDSSFEVPFLRGLQLYKSGASVTYSEGTTGYTGVNLNFNCSSGKCYYPEKDKKVALSTITGLNIPANAKILNVTAEGADTIDVNYGSRTLDTVTFNVVTTPKTNICSTCAYAQIIVEYESANVLSQPSLCAPVSGSGVNITNSSNMLIYSTTGSIKKIFTIYSGTSSNSTKNTSTYNSVYYPHNVILNYEKNDIVPAKTITTIPNAKTTCGIDTIAPGGFIKASSNNTISDDDKDPFKDISTNWEKVTKEAACDGSSYKVDNQDLVNSNVERIVNNQYCDIYCKEDIKIVVPSKAKAATGNDKIFAGRYFTLPDLKVEGRKTCVAEINIEKFFKDLYGTKYTIGEILSGAVDTIDLLHSNGGTNYEYMNASNWSEGLELAYTGAVTVYTNKDPKKCKRVCYVTCDYTYSAPDSCPAGTTSSSWTQCCTKSSVWPFSTTCSDRGEHIESGSSSYKVPYSEVSFVSYYVFIPDKDYQTYNGNKVTAYDRNGDPIFGNNPIEIYNTAGYVGAQFYQYHMDTGARYNRNTGESETQVDFINKDNYDETHYLDSCSDAKISGQSNYISWNCTAKEDPQSIEEVITACGMNNTAAKLGGVATSIRHQINVYNTIRETNLAKTLASIKDILACSKAYKYILYGIETPKVAVNYCDDYKIDYKFTGGVSQNVKVEYCKDGATSTDFACIGEGEVLEGSIDKIPDTKYNIKIGYYDCDGYCSDKDIVTVTVPINKSIKFEYTASFRANTDTKYYSILPSGVVRTNPTKGTSILLGEDGKVFPLSIGDVGNKACNYSFTFDTIGETHYEKCFPELEKPMVCGFVLYNQIVNPGNDEDSMGKMYFYRPIDLNDVFPNSNDDSSTKSLPKYRILGTNWSSEKGIDTQEEIEDLGEKVYLNENLSYSYTLTPKQMARIRAYNNKQENRSTGYADFNLTCDSEGQECRSSFLDGKMIGCEDKTCFTDNLNGDPASRNVSFKSYSDGTSWK